MTNAALQAQVSQSSPLPLSFPACLPLLWTRVLFPGEGIREKAINWWRLLVLIAIPGALLYPCLSFFLFEPDEGRYAEIPREMMVRGEWVVPYLQGAPYLDKPPLFYWLVMSSYRVLGVHDWSARLIPALAIHGCILLTYLFGRRSLGERAAFWGALALGLAPGFITVGRLLVLDGVLAFWVTLSIFAAFEATSGSRLHLGWWLLSAFACGLGILTKGPVAAILVLIPFFGHRLLSRPACPVGLLKGLAFAGFTLLVCLPWYVAVCFQLPEFAGYFLWKHNVLRFISPFDHQQPVWFYGPIIVIGLLPGSCLGLSFGKFLLAGDSRSANLRCPALGYMLLAGGWCVLFFSLSGSKLLTYVLPAFPPLSLALGYFIAHSTWHRSRWTISVCGIFAIMLIGAHYVAVPSYARFHSPMNRAEQVATYCSDPSVPIVCYPRNCDSVSFYLQRDDLHNFRSKETSALLQFLQTQPRTVLLFTHRHSAASLQNVLPSHLRLTGMTELSKSWADGMRTELCYMAIVEHKGR